MEHNDKTPQDLLAGLFPNAAAQLRASLGNIEIAISHLAPPERRDKDGRMDSDAAIAYQSYYRLLRLVNNFSDVGLLFDDSPLVLANCDLVDLVQTLYERVQSQAELLGLTLVFRCELLRAVTAINAGATERLLMNLFSNAFKFTPAGGTVTVELRRNAGKLLLSVSDTGCGIPEELLPTLFDRFLHTERNDPPPHGLGLGLPLCSQLARGQGGTLLAESHVGVGTTITCLLPDKRTEETIISDIPFDYSGGFNRTLLELADALPIAAFLQKNMD